MDTIKVDVPSLKIYNNAHAHRFEVALGEKHGLIAYRKLENVYVMTHTEVPEEYGGQGIATKLIHDALELVKAESSLVVPLCPAVKKFIERNAEYQPLVVHLPDAAEE